MCCGGAVSLCVVLGLVLVCNVWCGGVCGSHDSKHAVSVQGHADYAPNWVARTPGSKLPASPPPLLRPDGGGTPGRVPVYTALKTHPVTPRYELKLRRLRSFLHVETSNCRCTPTGMSTTLSKSSSNSSLNCLDLWWLWWLWF